VLALAVRVVLLAARAAQLRVELALRRVLEWPVITIGS
jgi:hypothetical protein